MRHDGVEGSADAHSKGFYGSCRGLVKERFVLAEDLLLAGALRYKATHAGIPAPKRQLPGPTSG